jgi:hypothetical protein
LQNKKGDDAEGSYLVFEAETEWWSSFQLAVSLYLQAWLNTITAATAQSTGLCTIQNHHCKNETAEETDGSYYVFKAKAEWWSYFEWTLSLYLQHRQEHCHWYYCNEVQDHVKWGPHWSEVVLPC